ncbi:MAG: hypothetical protein ABWK05_02905 [Pyrobaculum sp.]
MILRNVVLRLLEQAGGPVPKTKLVKLLYLVDRELVTRGRRPLFRWRLWLYGPFSREVLDILDWLEARRDVEKNVKVEGLKVTVWYKAVGKPGQLPPHVEEAVSAVAAKWATAPLDSILQHVYSLPEVREAELGEEIKWR